MKKKTTLFCKIITYKNTDEPFGSPLIGKKKEKKTPTQLHNVRMIVLNMSKEIRWNRKNKQK